jgi:hypothetical protein
VRKSLSREQYVSAVGNPARFRTLALGSSQSVRLRGALTAPCYWFERHNVVVEGDGTYALNTDEPTINFMVDGVISVIFYVTGAHLDSCTFAYHLSPEQLAKAVVAMKRARLGRLIVPAASFAVKDMPEVRRPVLETALRKLIASPRRRKKRK